MRAKLSVSTLIKFGALWLVAGGFLYVFVYNEYRRVPKADGYVTLFSDPWTKSDDELRRSRNSQPTPPVGVASQGDNDPGSSRKLCSQSAWVDGLPTIYMITPTYRRAEQIPELTRTAQTLLHVKNLVWIVVEDAPKPSQDVLDYLLFTGLKHVYLRAQMPEKFWKSKLKRKPRGVANRNAGIEWIRANATEGVAYFGDDDNTYDLRIFEETNHRMPTNFENTKS